MPDTQTYYQQITTPVWNAPSVVFNAALGPPSLPWAGNKRYAVLLDASLATSWYPAALYVTISTTQSTFIHITVCDQDHYTFLGEGGVEIGTADAVFPVGTATLVVPLTYVPGVTIYALYLRTQLDANQITLVSISDTPPAPPVGSERWAKKINTAEEVV